MSDKFFMGVVMRNLKSIFVLCLSLFIFTELLQGVPVKQAMAFSVANNQLGRINPAPGTYIDNCETLINADTALGYVFHLKPIGYIVVTADDQLSPIIAYSVNSTFDDETLQGSILSEILLADLSNRMKYNQLLPDQRQQRHIEWQNLLNNQQRPPLQQWPPEGNTGTGGWIKTRWTQSAPYNAMCPVDNVNGNRSLAGCPAVAMAQIVNYYGSLNGSVFSDTDDYHHNYGGNNYWIDGDSTAFDFPSFSRLNDYLQTASHHFRYQEEVTNQDKAAVVFGCAVAATQVFGSGGSGTFGVNQAMEAYQRFNFISMELLMPPDTTVTRRMAANMMEGRPVHYAIVTPSVTAGHNIVVDGYNTDGFFHTNFGWGGAYDGWYLLPDGLPYNLTVLEGAIVDIQPYSFAEVFPESLHYETVEDACEPEPITLWNTSAQGDIVLEAYDFDTNFAGQDWQIDGLDLPVTIPYGESIELIVRLMLPLTERDTLETNLRLILDNTVVNVPIYWNNAIQDADDNTVPPAIESTLLQNLPNPFRDITLIRFEMKSDDDVSLSIYNLKGEKVRTLTDARRVSGSQSFNWDGKDAQGNQCSSGIYLYKLKSREISQTKKMLLVK